MLLVDEYQDIADGHLPILEETLSHSPLRRVILTGTPKMVDNHLESVFRQSTACAFQVPCGQCGCGCILDARCLRPSGPICCACQAPIDPARGAGWLPTPAPRGAMATGSTISWCRGASTRTCSSGNVLTIPRISPTSASACPRPRVTTSSPRPSWRLAARNGRWRGQSRMYLPTSARSLSVALIGVAAPRRGPCWW